MGRRTVTTKKNQAGQYFVLVGGVEIGDICSRDYMGGGTALPAWAFHPSIRGLTSIACETKKECLGAVRDGAADGDFDDAITRALWTPTPWVSDDDGAA